MDNYALVADVGGTWARFALRDRSADGKPIGPLLELKEMSADNKVDFAQLLDHYLRNIAPTRPRHACIAVAGPVRNGVVKFSNRDWELSASILAEKFGFDRIALINDAAAGALASIGLEDSQVQALHAGNSDPTGVRINVVPGTGFGIGGAVCHAGQYQLLPGEGGHIGMPPRKADEFEVLAWIARHHGAATPDNCLSGPGMLNLYLAICAVNSIPTRSLTPAELTQIALEGTDQIAVETLNLYCRLLGRVAGDAALLMNASGGVFLSGGILRKIGVPRLSSEFQTGYKDKAVMAETVARIPVFLMNLDHPNLVGASVFLKNSGQFK